MNRTEASVHRGRVRERALTLRTPATGLVLVTAIAGWAALSALRSGGNAGPLVALCLTCAIAWGAGYLAATRAVSAVVPGLVAAAGALVLAMPGFWAEMRSPLGPPLGYANANAALFVQAEVAALMLFALSSRPWQRVAAGVLAGVFALVPMLIGSVAASILAVGLAAAAVLRRSRWVPAACALGLAVAVAATAMVGALGTGQRLVEGSRRPVLWGEAFSIMAARPVWGVGPQRFAETAPTALADPDAAWAHNEFLQQGAETGVPGLVLLAALFAWALTQAAGGAIGAAGVAALGMHATVDYVLHFAAVPVAGALLAGFAAGHVRKQGAESFRGRQASRRQARAAGVGAP